MYLAKVLLVFIFQNVMFGFPLQNCMKTGRTACGWSIAQKQRTSVTLGETQEDLSRESPYSTRDLSADEQSSDSTQKVNDGAVAQISGNEERDPLLGLLYSEDDSEPNADVPQQNPIAAGNREDQQKPNIDWPKASDKKAWEDLDRELDSILEATLQGPAERKMKAMTSLIYSVSRERFGTLEKKQAKPSVQPNRRQKQIIGTKKELKNLRKAFKNASPVEKKGPQDLRDTQRKNLGTLRRAEQIRQKRRKRARQRAAFTANPYQFSKRLFDKEKSGNLQDSLDDIQQFPNETHSDPSREDPLGDCQ